MRKTKKKGESLGGREALAKVAFCLEDSVCGAPTQKAFIEQENWSGYLVKVCDMMIPG